VKKIKNILIKIYKDDVFSLSAQFSYYVILGIFPFAILIVTLFSFYSSYFYYLLNSVKTILPIDVYEIIYNIIDGSTNRINDSYMPMSILALLWSASSASVGIIKGINHAYDSKINKNYILIRFEGLIFSLFIIISMQIVFGFIVLGRQFLIFFNNYIVITDSVLRFVNILRYVIPFIILVITFSLAYKFIPYKKITFKYTFIGAAFAALGCIVGSYIFSLYVSTRISYFNNIYGSLSGVFVFILWIYISSTIFLLGAELNASLEPK
jgi:membrane protein